MTRKRERDWTVKSYAAHNEALRDAQEKFEAERDRRYSELAIEREKALAIKETADLAALDLARDIQAYKDDKANELRSQIESERGSYATQADLKAAVEKLEATLAPMLDYIASQRGGRSQSLDTRTLVFALIAAAGVVTAIVLAFVGHH